MGDGVWRARKCVMGVESSKVGDGVWTARMWVLGCGESEGG